MSKTKAMNHEFIAVINKSVISVDAPDTILIVPWGHVDSTSGDFLVDEQSGRNIVAAFLEHNVLIPIDLEHQTLGEEFSSPDGSAPAMGWITALSAEAGKGIVASVEWTDRGKALVESKAYRYLSPVLSTMRGNRRVSSLHSVALTNKPAIVGMAPIVNKAGNVHLTSKFVFFEDARFFLGLDESAGEQKIMNELEVFLRKSAAGSVLSSNRQSIPAARARPSDPILAHRDRYDPDRIGVYERIKAHQEEHKCSYMKAMEACGA